jgi:hypothetical protein
MIGRAGQTLARSCIPVLTTKINDTMWRPVCSGQDRKRAR